MKRICWGLAATLFFIACSGDGGTAGSTFETENSVAKIIVTTADGDVAARHVVQIHRSDYLKGLDADSAKVLLGGRDSAETDSDGVLTLDTLVQGSYLVLAKGSSGETRTLGVSPFRIPAEVPDSGISVAVTVNAPAELSGKIETEKSPVTICLRGTSFTAKVDSQGNFRFPSVPQGNFEVVAVYATSILGSDSAHLSPSGESVSLSDTATKAFLFEDFEDSTVGWYRSVSEYATATLETDSAGLGRTGLAAHFTCQNDSAGNWALMGRALESPVDLSDLDSVSFWARGRVEKYITFSFDVLADSADAFESGKSWQHFELDSSWTRYTVTPETLLAPDSIGGNVGWDSVKDHVTNISIFGGAGGEFWVDDITFYGVEFP